MGRELRRKEAKKNNNIKKIKEIDTSIKGSTLLKLVIIGTILLVVLYFVIAIFITKEIEISWINGNNTTENEEQIENRILAKNTFNQKENDYYVYFYDFTDEDQTVTGATGLSVDPIYIVDTSSALNKNYVTEENGNRNTKSIEDLKVKSPTVIKISADKVAGYYEGSKEIIDHFEAR